MLGLLIENEEGTNGDEGGEGDGIGHENEMI
jgi:hypothetical protein